jgi:hypothetical protein
VFYPVNAERRGVLSVVRARIFVGVRRSAKECEGVSKCREVILVLWLCGVGVDGSDKAKR